MDQTVFFIRGFMRSGTNWLNRILNLHPDINAIGEFHLQALNHHFNHIYDKFYVDIEMYNNIGIDEFTNEYYKFIKNIIKAYCGDYPIVGDRTPTTLKKFIIPDCKYIFISRDGRDVVVSWFHHSLKVNAPILQKFPETLKKRELFLKDTSYFKNNPHELMTDEACFKHIAQLWNDFIVENKHICDTQTFSYYWIKYKQLHRETDKYRKEMYKFLGADPNKAPDLNNRTKPGVKQESNMGHDRKGIIGDWQSHFTDKNRKWFAEIAQPAVNILDSL